MAANGIYHHIVNEFTKAREEGRLFAPYDAITIYQQDADKLMSECGEEEWRKCPVTLKNVCAEGVYEAAVEFEKEETQTLMYQTFQRVNDLLNQANNPASPHPLGK